MLLAQGSCCSLQVLHRLTAPQLHVLGVLYLRIGYCYIIKCIVLDVAWLKNKVVATFIFYQLCHTDIEAAGYRLALGENIVGRCGNMHKLAYTSVGGKCPLSLGISGSEVGTIIHHHPLDSFSLGSLHTTFEHKPLGIGSNGGGQYRNKANTFSDYIHFNQIKNTTYSILFKQHYIKCFKNHCKGMPVVFQFDYEMFTFSLCNLFVMQRKCFRIEN